MYLLFDEAGKFMAGRVLSEADASAQVELDSGKRIKVKAGPGARTRTVPIHGGMCVQKVLPCRDYPGQRMGQSGHVSPL